MSPIRSILVHLDATPGSVGRLEFARSVARQHEATLSAMFAVSPPQRPVQLALSESPAGLFATTERADMERAKAVFEDTIGDSHLPTRWLDPGDSDPVIAFSKQALYADLLVLGQHDTSAAFNGSAPSDFAGSVLLYSGKPALVLPCVGTFENMGRDVLIGWNASPQAARAVSAALPWLRSARRVHVLESIDESGGAGAHLDIAQYLQLHGILPALHRQRQTAADAGEVLLSLAGDVDADLLVMGCYGHSRAREYVLGGASMTVLRSMTLPVLMAH